MNHFSHLCSVERRGCSSACTCVWRTEDNKELGTDGSESSQLRLREQGDWQEQVGNRVYLRSSNPISSPKANEDTKYNSVLHVRFRIIIVDFRCFVLAFWTCVILLPAQNSKLGTCILQTKIWEKELVFSRKIPGQ